MLNNWLVRMGLASAGAGFLIFGKDVIDMKMFRTISSVITDCFVALMLVLFQGGSSLLDMLPDLGLHEYGDAFTTAMALANTVNSFLPVLELVGIVIAVAYFIFIFLIAKLVLKLIPTIG